MGSNFSDSSPTITHTPIAPSPDQIPPIQPTPTEPDTNLSHHLSPKLADNDSHGSSAMHTPPSMKTMDRLKHFNGMLVFFMMLVPPSTNP